MTEVQLDSSIRSWVLVPMILGVMSFTLLRMNLMQLMRKEQHGDLEDIVARQKLSFARRFCSGGARFITPAGFRARQKHYSAPETGVLCKPPASAGMLGLPSKMANPKEMALQIGLTQGTQIGFGFLMDKLFSGYFVAKTPFTLTYKFKGMFQRGIDVPSLESCYVSSFSWYMITLFGSYGLLPIIYALRGQESDVSQLTAQDPMLNPHAMNRRTLKGFYV
eukprot:GHVN01041422.1.p1 GENE.GHVN01041422.1~~GHVN01041422.1.p1  ORF type:complete len:221 (+),score=12.26 GHVN01041422.1:125-787(+)